MAERWKATKDFNSRKEGVLLVLCPEKEKSVARIRNGSPNHESMGPQYRAYRKGGKRRDQSGRLTKKKSFNSIGVFGSPPQEKEKRAYNIALQEAVTKWLPYGGVSREKDSWGDRWPDDNRSPREKGGASLEKRSSCIGLLREPHRDGRKPIADQDAHWNGEREPPLKEKKVLRGEGGKMRREEKGLRGGPEGGIIK